MQSSIRILISGYKPERSSAHFQFLINVQILASIFLHVKYNTELQMFVFYSLKLPKTRMMVSLIHIYWELLIILRQCLFLTAVQGTYNIPVADKDDDKSYEKLSKIM